MNLESSLRSLGPQAQWDHQGDLTSGDSRFLCVLKVLAAQKSGEAILRIALELKGADFFEIWGPRTAESFTFPAAGV